MTTICTDNLTDIEYLEHMIPHHQVAVDISIMLQKKTKSAKMQKILRELIRIQTYEIEMMKMMKKKFPQKVSEDINNNKYIKTGSDFMKPNKLGLTQTYCDPHFFDPKGHMKHMEHMKLDDKVYLEHMIPHHQVAVDMRPESHTYLEYETFTLNDKTRKQVLIPPGFANGHLVMSDYGIFSYKQTTLYGGAKKQFTVKWNDPKVGIEWPIDNPILSLRDKNAKLL